MKHRARNYGPPSPKRAGACRPRNQGVRFKYQNRPNSLQVTIPSKPKVSAMHRDRRIASSSFAAYSFVSERFQPDSNVFFNLMNPLESFEIIICKLSVPKKLSIAKFSFLIFYLNHFCNFEFLSVKINEFNSWQHSKIFIVDLLYLYEKYVIFFNEVAFWILKTLLIILMKDNWLNLVFRVQKHVERWPNNTGKTDRL